MLDPGMDHLVSPGECTASFCTYSNKSRPIPTLLCLPKLGGTAMDALLLPSCPAATGAATDADPLSHLLGAAWSPHAAANTDPL